LFVQIDTQSRTVICVHVATAHLRAAVEAVLCNPAFRERAHALGASMRAAGGYRRAADAIQAFAGQ